MPVRTTSVVMLIAVAAMLATSGCRSGPEVRVYPGAKKLPRVRALVLLEPECYFRNMEAYQVAEKWLDFVHLAATTDLVLIGPQEFEVRVSSVVTNLAQETSIPEVLESYGVAPEEALAVRFALTESWQQVQRAVSNKDGTRSGRVEFESRLEFSADLYQVSSSRPVVSFTRTLEETFPALPTGTDSRPAITAFARANYERVIEHLTNEHGVVTRYAGELVVLDSPRTVAHYGTDALPALVAGIDKGDALARDAALNARVEYRNPALDRGLRKLLRKAPQGVVVARAPACANLLPGDIVAQVNGRPVTLAYQFRRAVDSTPQGRPVTFVVERDGARYQAVYECMRGAPALR